MHWVAHDDFATLCRSLAPSLADTLRAGIERHGRAAAALAGGATPFPLYRELAGQSLDWAQVTLMPGDERWVAADHEASNLRAIRGAFRAVPARFGALVPDEPGALPSLTVARATLDAVAGPLDLCVLGMGLDGHFASLFPHAPELATALDPDDEQALVIVRPDPLPENAPFARVSLTLSAISAARRIVLVLRGQDKREVIEHARGADPARYPVAALLDHCDRTLDIHWSP